MSTPTRIMLVEDHTLMREGIKSLLSTVGNICIVQEAASGQEARARLAAASPDVVLMDINLPDIDGIQLTAELRRTWPAVRVVVLSMYTDAHYIFDAFQAGAAGYLTKSVSRAELVDTITLVMQGQTVLPRSAVQFITRSHRTAPAWPTDSRPHPAAALPAVGSLSSREREVLGLVAEGCDTDEVAHRLYISPKTVKTHLQHIYGKLKVRDRLQAVVAANRKGLL